YDHDKLETAETMRIERRIYFEAKDGEIAPYVSLPLEQLHAMREESAAAEQAIFNDLSSRAAAWEEQAGRTLLLDKTLEYVRTPHVQHTATPALNTLKVLRGAPISMGRGETPVRLQLTTARFCLLTNIVYPYRKKRIF